MNKAIPPSSRDNTAIEAGIKRFLLEDPDFGLQIRDLSADQSLLAGGLIDSLAVLDIIAFLESRFHVQFEPEDLTAENFDRISSMAALVRSQIDESKSNSQG